MPHKHYHGRTGVIFNVNKRAVGLEVNKKVNGRLIKKRIHVAIPHIHKSKCRDEIIRRVKENETAKKNGGGVLLKRQNTLPKAGYAQAFGDVATIQATPYVDLV
jgi:large subunit ribosomal protein L21e